MLTQAEYVRLKRRLTTLENKLSRCLVSDPIIFDENDPRVPIYRAIAKEVLYAFAIFEREGYPDAWARWQRAGDDAAWQLGQFYPGYEEAVA